MVCRCMRGVHADSYSLAEIKVHKHDKRTVSMFIFLYRLRDSA